METNRGKKTMKKFWELFGQSVITQSIITIMITGVWCYMMVAQIPVPNGLTEAVAIVLGFFFGSKYAMAMNTAASNSNNANKIQ